MININLVPDDQRRKVRSGGIFSGGFVLPREVIIGLIGGFLALLAAGHIILQGFIIVKYVQLKGLQNRWEKVLPEKKAVDELIRELRNKQARMKTIEEVRGDQNVSWTRKLQAVSEVLPRGIWLRHAAFDKYELLIHGSSVSKQGEEMIAVYSFVKELRESALFMEGVMSVDPEPVKTRKVGDSSVADFVIRVVLNHSEVKPPEAQGAKSAGAPKTQRQGGQ